MSSLESTSSGLRTVLTPAPRSGTFVPRPLLEAAFDGWDAGPRRRELACELRGWLRALDVREAWLDVAIGRGVARLVEGKGYRDLSHSRLKDFAFGRFGFSWGHARELVRIAEKLPELPRLEAAFLSGRIRRSQLREILDVATPETEAGWLRLARRRTTRGLRDAVRAFRGGAAVDLAQSEAQEDLETLSLDVEPEVAAAWRVAREVGRAALGEDVPDWKILEAMAATAIADHGGPDEVDEGVEDIAPRRTRKQRLARAITVDELIAIGRDVAPVMSAWTIELPAPPESTIVRELLDHVMLLVGLQRGLVFERARLLLWMDGRRLHRDLDARTFFDFTRRELGLSYRDTRQLLQLSADVRFFPALEAAWRTGELGAHTVAMLLRVATPTTEAAWVAHARRCTLKRLTEECEGGRPKIPECVDAEWEGMACVDGGGGDDSECVSFPPARLPRLRLHFRMPRAVATVVRMALDRLSEVTGLSRGRCFGQMVTNFVNEMVASEQASDPRGRHAIFKRDGFRCTMPHCRSRSELHAHHVVYRSAGGGDDDENKTSIDLGCHQLEHEHRVAIRGLAPDALSVHVPAAQELYRDGCLVAA